MPCVLFLLLAIVYPAYSANDPYNVAFQGRIENEYILDVPAHMVDKVWGYMKSANAHEENLLSLLGPEYSSTTAEENFVDVYYDTANFQLFKNNTGLRHRTRIIPENPNDRKNGRQLIQLKEKTDDIHKTFRTEIKYKAEPPMQQKTFWDRHPLVSMISPKEREHFFMEMRKQDADSAELRAVLTNQQLRQRLYIRRNNAPYITLTLDTSSAKRFGKEIRFYSIDIEIGEVVYTKATPVERIKMQATIDKIKRVINIKFPELVQDQLPKYTKMLLLFDQAMPDYRERVMHPLRWFFKKYLLWGLGITFLLALFLSLWRFPGYANFSHLWKRKNAV